MIGISTPTTIIQLSPLLTIRKYLDVWPPQSKLVGGFNPFEKHYSQIGSFPQVGGMKIKNIWNHHLEKHSHVSGVFFSFILHPSLQLPTIGRPPNGSRSLASHCGARWSPLRSGVAGDFFRWFWVYQNYGAKTKATWISGVNLGLNYWFIGGLDSWDLLFFVKKHATLGVSLPNHQQPKRTN